MSHSLTPGWDLRRLDEIADVRLGRQRSPKNHAGTQMRPYLRAANVGWSGLLLDDVKEMNFTDDEMTTYRLEPDDILLSEASGSAGEVGKPAIWSGEVVDCAFQNTLLRVRSRGPVPTYLLHFFRHLALSQAFARRSRGVGIHHIGRAALASWPVPLPPLAEQRRIVEILEDNLSRLDVATENLRRSRGHVASMRTSFLNKERRAMDACGTALYRVGDVCETALGKMLDAKKAVGSPTPYLRNINVRWGSVDLSDVLSVPLTDDERVRFALQLGDLLVCEGGEPGRCAVWSGSVELMAFQKALHRLRPRNNVAPEFVAAMIEEFIRTGRGARLFTGTTIKHLPQEKLREIVIPVPDRDDQTKLLDALAELQRASCRVSNTLEASERRADSLRRSLLSAAFAGRLVGTQSHEMGEEPANV